MGGPELVIGVCSGGSPMGLSPYPSGSVLTQGSVRIELNCKTPSWCMESWRIGWGGMPPFPRLASELL